MSSDQELRTKLRKEFLTALDKLIIGKEVELTLHSGFKTEARIMGSDRDIHHFYVQNMKTPTGEVIAEGILRATDIVSLTVKQD